MLRAVDISSWQAGISPSALDCDIVIIKATGGTDYENPYWRQWADETLASGKLLGLYHFACERGSAGSAHEEAEHFLAAVAPYEGCFVPILDWESDALQMPVSWAQEWLDRVYAETGSTPMFYGYANNVNSTDYSAITRYPLWMASYLFRYDGAGWVDDPLNTWGTGNWDAMSMYQYTSTGYISGYDSRLDLSIYYGSEADWKCLEGVKAMGQGYVAAAIHRDMCEDDDNGYSWSPRHGEDGEGIKTITIDGRQYSYDRGSWDCSSSTIEAWKEALKYTKYAHALDGASTTFDMRAVFVGSDLFDWMPMSFTACPGDLYLDEDQHVAMCQSQEPDMLSEFCSNEWGGAYGGAPGDQTGYEAYVHAYYSGNWDGILHYNGKADGEMASGEWLKGTSAGNTGKWWYRHPDGSCTKSDWEFIEGKWYYFDAEGWMVSGWVDWDGERYYCQPKTAKTGNDYGWMVTGARTIGGKRYYFEPNGIMFRNGFRRAASGKWYCFGKDGARIMDDKRITVSSKTGAIRIG